MLNSEDYEPTGDNEELDQRVSNLIKKGIAGKPKGQKKPRRVEKSQHNYDRDPQVKAWIIDNANGTCELCDSPGPFVDKHGNRFLEVHHVVYLADGGPDTIENAVALCPNCHRECHHSPKKVKIAHKVKNKIERILTR